MHGVPFVTGLAASTLLTTARAPGLALAKRRYGTDGQTLQLERTSLSPRPCCVVASAAARSRGDPASWGSSLMFFRPLFRVMRRQLVISRFK
jgi:hypothetical protein